MNPIKRGYFVGNPVIELELPNGVASPPEADRNDAMNMPQWIQVATVDDIPMDLGKVVEIGDRQIAIFRHEGSFKAIDNLCTHRAGPLAAGDKEGSIVTCPWHGWRFDICTGQSPDIPKEKIETFPIKVEGSIIYIALNH